MRELRVQVIRGVYYPYYPRVFEFKKIIRTARTLVEMGILKLLRFKRQLLSIQGSKDPVMIRMMLINMMMDLQSKRA